MSAREMNAEVLTEIIERAGFACSYEPQTGGGIGCIFVGEPDAEGYHFATLGPWDGASGALLDEGLYVGRDDGRGADRSASGYRQALVALGDLYAEAKDKPRQWAAYCAAMYASWEQEGSVSPSAFDCAREAVEIFERPSTERERLADLIDDGDGHLTLVQIGEMIAAEERADVIVPGSIFAEWVDGKIVRLSFTPAAADAGYFGPSAVLFDGADIDVEDTDGPFWRAMQAALAPTTYFPAEHSERDENRTTVEIGWSE